MVVERAIVAMVLGVERGLEVRAGVGVVGG